ncbi:MAG TPA: hypothetical protein VGL70_06605 [Candidatus Binatia bacterium]|jgi:uncharacterized membrane protein
MLTSWFHLLALTAYVGAVAGLLAIVLPGLALVETHEARVKLLSRSLKFYNPMQSGALGLLVLTGAIQITDLKAEYREFFTREFGAMLGSKLILSFVLILLSTHQSMAVALRFVRRSQGGEPIAPDELQSVTKRLTRSTLFLLALSAVTVWMGTQLRR